MIAASEESTCCSPGGDQRERDRDLQERVGGEPAALAASASASAPARCASTSSTAAASTTRDQATNAGESPSSTATLMNRYGIPQRTDIVANPAHARAVIRSESRPTLSLRGRPRSCSGAPKGSDPVAAALPPEALAEPDQHGCSCRSRVAGRARLRAERGTRGAAARLHAAGGAAGRGAGRARAAGVRRGLRRLRSRWWRAPAGVGGPSAARPPRPRRATANVYGAARSSSAVRPTCVAAAGSTWPAVPSAGPCCGCCPRASTAAAVTRSRPACGAPPRVRTSRRPAPHAGGASSCAGCPRHATDDRAAARHPRHARRSR